MDFYSAFADYPLREHVPGCPCCIDGDVPRWDLRSIRPDQLDRYSFTVLGPPGVGVSGLA